VLHLAERHQLSLIEVPVAVTHSSRSTVREARDAVRLVADLFRIRHWSAAGAYEADGDVPPVAADPVPAPPGAGGPRD
jgi:hypothetical protein